MQRIYPYNRYLDYLKSIYHERIQKINIDAGFTCPNRDGTKGTAGCIYCNNESFSLSSEQKKLSVKAQVLHGIESGRKRYKKVKKFFVYFQAYSNTYAPLERLKRLYEEALSVEGVVGLCIGTRPDCIDDEKLLYLASLSKETDLTIEYGIESVFDETLKKVNRGHDFKRTEEAFKKTRSLGIKTCGHIILGFPWEERNSVIESAKKVSVLSPDFLKIHQLEIVKGTKLFLEHKKNPFKLLNINEYMDLLILFLEHLDPKIVIQRLLKEAPLKRELVLEKRDLNKFLDLFCEKMLTQDAYQGKCFLN